MNLGHKVWYNGFTLDLIFIWFKFTQPQNCICFILSRNIVSYNITQLHFFYLKTDTIKSDPYPFLPINMTKKQIKLKN